MLLPLLPALGVAAQGGGFDLSASERLGPLGLLLGLGVVLAILLPAALERAGGQVRKEVEQLRRVWLGGMLVVQVAVLPSAGGAELGAWALAGMLALLGATPFGAEFQHRTLPGLLSQPAGRMSVWRVKMGVLAGALVSLWAVHGLSVRVMGSSVDGRTGLLLLGVVAIAWGTGPWWTLVTRGLLAGLVFSVALPMVTTVGVAVAIGGLSGQGMTEAWPGWADALVHGLLFVGVPAYAAAGAMGSVRCWRRLEAPDAGADELTAVWGVGRPGSRTVGRRARPGGWRLVVKELRLQTVTLASLAAMLVLGVGRVWVPASWTVHLLLQGAQLLLAGTTLLLAGATAIAEERRLGTLEGQLLVPVSRKAQWRIKAGVALGIAVVAWGALFGATGGLLPVTQWFLGGLAVGALPLALLASSGSAHALRALVSSLVLVAVAAAVVGLASSASQRMEVALVNALHQSALNEQAAWIDKARHLSASERAWVEDVYRSTRAYERLERLRVWVTLPLVIPIGLVWVLARRNFLAPAGAPRRWARQAALSLGVLGVLALGGAAIYVRGHLNYTRATYLSAGLNWLEVDARLTAGERALREAMASPAVLWPGVRVSLRPLPNDTPTVAVENGDAARRSGRTPDHRRWIPLPLNATNRALLLERAVLPEAVREALQAEQAAEVSVAPR